MVEDLPALDRPAFVDTGRPGPGPLMSVTSADRERSAAGRRDPFRSSVMGKAASRRLLAVAGLIGALWLAIAWAVSLP